MPDWPARVEDHDIGTAARYVHALAGRTGLELLPTGRCGTCSELG